MFFLQVVGSISQEIAKSIQPGMAGAVYWAIVFGATSLAVTILYESLVGAEDPGSLAEDSNEDQVLKQAA